MTAVREVHVAVGVIFRKGKVLIARRPDHVHQGGLLEFPGGKVEADETVQQALVREIREETGLEIAPETLEPVIEVRHDYGDKRVFLDVWQTSKAKGSPQGREGQEISWLEMRELTDSDFPAANRPIIQALRLPHEYTITGRAADLKAYLRRLELGLETTKPELCLLRAPELNEDSYAQLVAWALEACSAGGVRWMLHGAPSVLEQFPLAFGLHMPWHEARQYATRPVSSEYLLAVSCHSADEIAHAVQLQADFITLGAVKPTPSHPNVSGMGWDRFRELVAVSAVPVYALGGLSPTDIESARGAGAQGIAGISFWWPSA